MIISGVHRVQYMYGASIFECCCCKKQNHHNKVDLQAITKANLNLEYLCIKLDCLCHYSASSFKQYCQILIQMCT